MWGAIIGAGASILGGVLSSKSQKKQQQQQYQQEQAATAEQRKYLNERYDIERADSISDQINSLPRLRESAEKAGFNPLSALSTGGGGFGQTGVRTGAVSMGSVAQPAVAPLSSAAILTNAVSGIADAWLTKRADDANRAKVEGEIWQRQIEKERAGGAGETIRRTVQRAGVADLGNRATAAAPVSGRAAEGMGPFGLWNVMPSVGGTPAVELKMPENVTREHIGPLKQSMTRDDGSRIEIPVGPDIDEVLMGVALDKGPEIWDRGKNLARGLWSLTMPTLTPMGQQRVKENAGALRQWYDSPRGDRLKGGLDWLQGN